jgi:O-antigen/teichoic acid export membrane protein
MGWYNAWLTTERVAAVATAFVLFELMGMRDPARGLATYGVVTAVAMFCVMSLTLIAAFRLDKRLVPSPALAAPRAAWRLVQLGGWNALVVLAMNLHLRLGQFLCNFIAGLVGNTVFGLATQLTSYARMATVGMTDGLDAVATRISSGDDSQTRLRRACAVSTKMHALVALPAGVCIAVLAGPLLDVWLGSKVEDKATVLPLAEVCVRVLAFGIAARAIADGWTRLLYGAGHIKKYAWLILAGGITNPVLTGLLVLLLPQRNDIFAPAAAFTIIFSTAHLFGIPAIAARCLGCSYASMFAPILRPALATALAAPTLWIGGWLGTGLGVGPTLGLAASVGAFGIVYAALTLTFIITPQERRALLKGRGGPRRSGDDRDATPENPES